MTNLPPGVTDTMLPGNEPFGGTLTPEDFVEVDLAEWANWGVSEGEAACDLCGEVIGYYLGRSAANPDADTEEWAACWIVAPWEQIVCGDCREHLATEYA